MSETQDNVKAFNARVDQCVEILTQCYMSAEAAHLINPDKLEKDDMIALILRSFAEALMSRLAKDGLAGMAAEPPCILALAAVAYLRKHPEAREDFKL